MLEQMATGFERFDNFWLRFINMLADKNFGFRQIHAVTCDWVFGGQVKFLPDHIVIDTVRGRSVYQTRTAICRHVVACDNRHLTLGNQWMLRFKYS